jgi:hypothetical protein
MVPVPTSSVKIMEKKEEKRKEDPRKKKAFAFFHIEIIVSFSSLFSIHTAKVNCLSLHFHVGVAAEMPWWFSSYRLA